MESFEKVVIGVAKRPGFVKKVAVGFALSLIPVMNLFSLRYLMLFGLNKGQQSCYDLPEWGKFSSETRKSLPNCIKNLLLSFGVFFVTMMLPAMIGGGLFGLVNRATFGFCLGFMVGAPAFAFAATSADLTTKCGIKEIFKELSKIYGMVFHYCRHLIIPMLLVLCLQILAWVALLPIFVLGTGFLGLIFLIPYVRRLNK